MEIVFSITYRAEWGQSLCISGSSAELGNWNENLALNLTPMGDDKWVGTVAIDGRRKDIQYYYFVKDRAGKSVRKEWKRMHHLILDQSYKKVLMEDYWIDRPKNSPFFSSAFYDVFFRHEEKLERAPKSQKKCVKVVMQLYAPCVRPNQQIYMTGNSPALGDWSIKKALPMHHLGQGEWSLTLDGDDLPSDFHYKFFISGNDSDQDIRWEEGEDRTYRFRDVSEYGAVYLAGLCFREGEYMPRYAGTVLPLFSVRSESDWGIGDFGSLCKLIDWTAKTGQHVVQLLPINDTTYTRTRSDSYPYNVVSVMALHPIYVDVNALPALKDEDLMSDFCMRAEALRQKDEMDYVSVLALKEDYLHALFRQSGAAIMRKKAFRQFVSLGSDWLDPYAVFCCLRDKYEGLPLYLWPEYTSSKKHIERLIMSPELKKELNYYRFVQFLLHEQLSSASLYAEQKGILLKGDIPIGVSPNSVEVWLEPSLFDTEHAAGAPPDHFSEDGQNWGFPIYEWGRMEQDDFAWWRKRFERMSNYFKAFRLDHILGFFRIWEIPIKQRSALLGHFCPSIAMTEQEIKNYGLPFDHDFCTFPLIHVEDLKSLFGEYASDVRYQYLRPFNSDYYTLVAKYFYQSDIAAMNPAAVPGGRKTMEGLMKVATEVAFVTDPDRPSSFHPRVNFDRSLRFVHLSIEEKQAWKRLYEDYFYKRNNDLWKRNAFEHLVPLLSSTDMLACAEDLGMIPPAVPALMEELQLLSLVLERIPKELGLDFADIYSQPYYSVCTTSTHDMPPIRLWWKQNVELRQRYFTDKLGQTGIAPSVCTPDLVHRILRRHLEAASMLAVLPLSDWMALSADLQQKISPESEQINQPEIPNHYWGYRMPISIESLMADYSALNDAVFTLIRKSRRA